MSATTTIVKTCFENIIGLRDTQPAIIPTSGFFIDDAGIPRNELDEYATEEFTDGPDLFIKKMNFSIHEVVSKVHTVMNPKYRANSVIENMRIGFFQDNLKMVAPIPGYLRLLKFELLNSDSYVDLNINEISLMVNYDGDVDVTVFDLITGKNIDTITIPCKANERSTVYPLKSYKSTRQKMNLIFAYDSGTIESNTTWLMRNGSCTGCNGDRNYKNQYIRITPGKIDSTAAKIDSNVVATSDTGGLSIVYNLSCNHYEWLCSVQKIIALPILWKTAEKIMEHAALVVPGQQMTPRTQSSHLLYARMRAYQENFNQSFDEAMKNIALPTDAKCFVCNNRIRTTYSIPS